jgi:hypothetical protein
MTRQLISVRFLTPQLAAGGIQEADKPVIRVIRPPATQIERANQFSPEPAPGATPGGNVWEAISYAVLWLCGWIAIAVCFF